MRDYTQRQHEAGRSDEPVEDSIDYCLQQLFADQTHSAKDTCAGTMTYEQLIKALLAARQQIAHAKGGYPSKSSGPKPSLLGALKGHGIAPGVEDIQELRAAMWGNCPQDES